MKINVILLLLILAPLKLFAGSYDKEIKKYSGQYGLDPDLVRAVIQVESKHCPDAVSSAGAKGLMQIMPATFAEWSRKCRIDCPDVFKPDHNIHVGCAYLQWCIKHTGSVERGLIAYNRGLTRGRRENWTIDWYWKRVMKVKSGEEKILIWCMILWSIALISCAIPVCSRKGR